MEALAKINVVINFKGKEVKRIVLIQQADWVIGSFFGVVTTPDGQMTGQWVFNTYYDLPLFWNRKGGDQGCLPIKTAIRNAVYEWKERREQNRREKMIYTSYFAMARKIGDKDKLLSIALWPPKDIHIQCMPYLAPTREILLRYKEDHDEEAYTKAYREQVLGKLDVNKVAAHLQGRILLCYERPGMFCHRHIVAQWLQESGYDCEELRLEDWRRECPF